VISLFPSYARNYIRYISSITHTHPFDSPLSETTRVSWYQKGQTNLDFTEARDTECQWHQLGHMQVCTSLQTDNHASTPSLKFLQARCPSCRATNSVKVDSFHWCTLYVGFKGLFPVSGIWHHLTSLVIAIF